MINTEIPLDQILNSVSETHNFPNPDVIFLNTSDVLDGKILHSEYSPVKGLKGQAKKTIENGDILFSEIRPKNRRFAFVNVPNPEDYVVSTKLMVLRNKKPESVYTDYIYYFLTYEGTLNYLQMRAENRIGSFPQITFDVLKPIKIRIPPLGEQTRIATLLSALDAKIALNQRINAELEALAQRLYQYWFVQFDFPYDFERGQPDPQGRPYKSSGGEMVWREGLKRAVPKGWGVKKLGEVLKTSLGGTPSTKDREYWRGDIPWLSSGEISNFPVIESEAKITDRAIDNSATKLLPAGTVAISITRYIRPTILAIDACANQSVVGILESESFRSSFIYPYLKTQVPRFMSMRTGANQPHINKETVDESSFIVPPLEILEGYYELAGGIYQKIINGAFQSHHLSSLRDWLLPMLMNGQVEVGAVFSPPTGDTSL